MAKAMWNGAVLAESETTHIVEGNHYFPPSGVRKEFFKKSETHTTCPWKGVASYYHVVVNAGLDLGPGGSVVPGHLQGVGDLRVSPSTPSFRHFERRRTE